MNLLTTATFYLQNASPKAVLDFCRVIWFVTDKIAISYNIWLRRRNYF